MTPAYQAILSASADDKRGLFSEAAIQIGTTIQNIEKDFWVCCVLDLLFNHLGEGSPRLLFKGGTSLSKGYSLIARFSEDIDVTVFRSDLGEEATVAELESLTRKQRERCLGAIRSACQTYIGQELRIKLQTICKELMEASKLDAGQLEIVLDENDADRQTLLVQYPSVAGGEGAYVRPSIKIESGAKSALDPNESKIIVPYVASVIAGDAGSLNVPNVRTIYPQRTFIDKVLILHGMSFYFEATGRLRGDGRMSRHYYDVHKLIGTDVGKGACTDAALIEECVRHARVFFYRNNTGLEEAKRGAFRLAPAGPMVPELRQDYEAMATMIFGEVPSFDAVVQSIAEAEDLLNSGA